MSQEIEDITLDDPGISRAELVEYIITRTLRDADEGARTAEKVRMAAQSRDEIVEVYKRLHALVGAEDDEARIAFVETLSFGSEAARDDLEKWARKPSWTAKEAAALLYSRRPDLVNWDEVRRYAAMLPEAAVLEEALDNITRAVDRGLLPKLIVPRALLAWAATAELPVPPDLEKLVHARDASNPEWQLHIAELESELAKSTAALAAAGEEIATLKTANDDFEKKIKKVEARSKDDFPHGKVRKTVYSLLLGSLWFGQRLKVEPAGIPDESGVRKQLEDFLLKLKQETNTSVGIDAALAWLKDAQDEINFQVKSSKKSA